MLDKKIFFGSSQFDLARVNQPLYLTPDVSALEDGSA